MPKPNYSYEKRQRELAKKKKQEEKRQRKATVKQPGDSADEADGADTPAQNTPPAPASGTP
jgi:hypothetical protein